MAREGANDLAKAYCENSLEHVLAATTAILKHTLLLMETLLHEVHILHAAVNDQTLMHEPVHSPVATL